MKKILFMILISTILIAACSTPAPTPPAPAVSTKAPAVVNTTVPPPTPIQPPRPISTEFTPSDPKSVKLNAGKPQLVEFFAFW